MEYANPELESLNPDGASRLSQREGQPAGRRRISAVRARPEMTLDELLAAWKIKHMPSLKTLAAVQKAVADFTSYIGNIGIGEIIADDCFEFRDALEKMPRSMPHAHRCLPFIETHAIYSNRGIVTRLAPASVKKYLGAIQALLSFAFQERWIPANPGTGILVDGYRKTGKRRPFTKDELGQLFTAPLFVLPWSENRSCSKVSDRTLRWLFLLGLFTGARIEELGQLWLADIKDELGMPYIAVTDYGPATDGGDTKRLKTPGSARLLPIHPQLIALGLLDHVAQLRREGATRLFSDLEADQLQVKTKEASRRAARLIDAVVGPDPRIVFHSLRHSFKDACRDADIPKDVHDQITGHSPADVGSGYGMGRAIATLDRHMRRITLPFLDWHAIEAASRK